METASRGGADQVPAPARLPGPFRERVVQLPEHIRRFERAAVRRLDALESLRGLIALEERREHAAVMVVRLDPNLPDERGRARAPGLRILESAGPSSRDARVEHLLPAREVDLAADHVLDACPLDLATVAVHLPHREEHPRRDVGGEGVADRPAVERELGPERALLDARHPELDLDGPAHHLGIVDAAPQVLAIGHVAALARPPFRRSRALPPLGKRVLDGLSVQAGIVKELMALCAEPALGELGTFLEPAVRERA